MDMSINSVNCVGIKEPELSIIIPVYNVERYLKACVDSVLQQTFTNFELILIDDGSLDRSGLICDEYAAEDSRVHVYHQKNSGVSSARNVGLANINGNYVSFVDADDCLNNKMYEIMIRTMKSEKAGLVICGFDMIDEDESIRHNDYHKSNVITWSGSRCVSHLFDMPPSIYNSCCNKLFRRNLIETKFDPCLKLCEDAKFLIEYLRKTCKIIYMPDYKLYMVRNRIGSATRSDQRVFVKSLKTRYEICNVVREVFPECYEKAMHHYYDTCVIVYNKVKKDKKSRKRVRGIMRKNLKRAMLSKGVPVKLKVVYLMACIPKPV